MTKVSTGPEGVRKKRKTWRLGKSQGILFWARKVRSQRKLACKNISGHSDLVFHNEIGVLLLWKRKGRFWTGSMCHCMRQPYVTYFIYLAWEIFIFIGCGNHGNVVFLILLVIGYYLYALRHRIPDFNTSEEECSLLREMSVYVELSKLVLILDNIVML